MLALKGQAMHKYLLVLILGGPVLTQGEVFGADIDQEVARGGIAVVHTGKGDVRIGITLADYEAGLKTREKEVTERLEKAHAKERALYERELAGIQERLQDSRRSYEEHIKDLRKRIEQLEAIRGQVPDDVPRRPRPRLQVGIRKRPMRCFGRSRTRRLKRSEWLERRDISVVRSHSIHSVSRCLHALSAGVPAVPGECDLPEVRARLSILGRYRMAGDYFEKAMESDLKTYGVDHPTWRQIATIWAGPGTLWASMRRRSVITSTHWKVI